MQPQLLLLLPLLQLATWSEINGGLVSSSNSCKGWFRAGSGAGQIRG